MSALQRVSALWWLVGIYVLLTIVTLAVWDARGVYGLTGDEPHYLVMADSLLRDGSWEVSGAYQREIADPNFYPLGLGQADMGGSGALGPPAAHVVETARGYFSWHGWGIPLAIAAVFPWVGMFGAKALMAASGLVVIASAWRISARFAFSAQRRLAAVASVSLAYPLLLASGQIFPDLWAGAICVLAVAWLLSRPWQESPAMTAVIGLSIGALPWLGMKFSIAAAVLAIIVLARLLVDRRTGLVALFSVPLVILASGLVVYHLSAFGNLLGPPTQGTLVFGRDFWMLLPGLMFDQNQGLLFFSPILWLALPGLVLLWKVARQVAVVWSLVFLAIWIPGAAHPGLYGIGSFNGRYAWALACLAIVPALFALAGAFRRAPRWAWALVAAGLVFQAYVWALGTFISGGGPGLPAGLDLYTKPAGTWLESYSLWWFPLQNLLPAWYDSAWAFSFAPNYLWTGIALLAVVLVLPPLRRANIASTGSRLTVGVALVGAVIVVGVLANPGERLEVTAVDVTASPGSGQIGPLADGPQRAMRWGPYTWAVEYTAGGAAPVGRWELIRAADGQVVASAELVGTSGEQGVEQVVIPYRALTPAEYFPRVSWYGTADFRLNALSVAHGNR